MRTLTQAVLVLFMLFSSAPAHADTYAGQQVASYYNGHPVNSAGYVMDGSPQKNDEHCTEPGQTTKMIVACLVARRPECRNHGVAMDRYTAMACWAPMINAYPWPAVPMFDALYCESKGDEQASNGNHFSLFQSTDYVTNAIDSFEDAFYVKWRGQGPSAWAASYGRYCPN